MLRSKWMAGAVALALVGTTTLAAVTPADAQWRGRHGGGWHGGGHYHRGGGWGGGGAVLGGLAAGAILGGAIAASRPYGYYDYGPDYYYGGPPVYAAPAGDDVAYCMSRFKSYDPASGTYLGYDGYRHPCP
ncbi:MAG: BA14K family protein [Pseudolabrys sp.]